MCFKPLGVPAVRSSIPLFAIRPDGRSVGPIENSMLDRPSDSKKFVRRWDIDVGSCSNAYSLVVV